MSKKKKLDAEVESAFVNSMPPIEELSIDDLKPYKNNPRFNEDAVPKVAASLKNFGWWQPVVIDKNNEIVVGHTRVAAAKSLGWKSAPCVRASRLTPEQIRAYRLADNKTNEFSQWDEIKLTEEFALLPDYNMEQFGFDMESGDDISDAFGDGDPTDTAPYKDADKVNFKIPIEFLDRVRKWLREGGREKTIKWLLVQSGCIEDGDPLPEGVEIASDEDIGDDTEEQ